jgi:SAM-dependent methyltransferase
MTTTHFVDIPCPICESDAALRRLTTDRERNIVVCRSCDLAFVSPQPDESYLSAIYQESYFSRGEPGTGYQDYGALSELLTRIAVKNMATISELRPTRGRLLDVGCATGEFLGVANSEGWAAYGVELSPDGRRACVEKGLSVVGDRLVDLPTEPAYDVVTYWDVLEHVTNPVAELRAAHARLAPGGLFATTMPNFGSLRSRLQRGRWWAFYSSREHLFFFSRRSLTAALDKAGFQVVRTATTTMDLRPAPRRADPPVSYFESRRPAMRVLERAGLGHVLFLFAERRP